MVNEPGRHHSTLPASHLLPFPFRLDSESRRHCIDKENGNRFTQTTSRPRNPHRLVFIFFRKDGLSGKRDTTLGETRDESTIRQKSEALNTDMFRSIQMNSNPLSTKWCSIDFLHTGPMLFHHTSLNNKKEDRIEYQDVSH